MITVGELIEQLKQLDKDLIVKTSDRDQGGYYGTISDIEDVSFETWKRNGKDYIVLS